MINSQEKREIFEHAKILLMSDITQILNQIECGNPGAAQRLLPLVYDELRKLAAHRMDLERAGQTLQATALVHEAYVRLVDVDKPQDWNGRGHFFAAAAEAMRRILVENARRKDRVKHGGEFERHEFPEDGIAGPEIDDPAELLAVHEALESLAVKSPRKAELVKLRYFLGCTLNEASEIQGIAPATAEDDWRYAKAWLHRQLGRE